MDVPAPRRHSPVRMTFEIERMDLTDGEGAPGWTQETARRCGAAFGGDAQSVLAAVVARDGGVQVGVAATYVDGQAVMLARKGAVVYAFRARPLRSPRHSQDQRSAG
jgi:hypothetical protein